MDIIFCAAARMLPDLLCSSDSSSQEGAYLNEMEGPSLSGANSITCPPPPGLLSIHSGESELEMAFGVLRVGRRLVKESGDRRWQ